MEECQTLDKLEKIKHETQQRIEECMEKLAQAYDQDQDLNKTQDLAIELQYFMKIAIEIGTIQERLET